MKKKSIAWALSLCSLAALNGQEIKGKVSTFEGDSLPPVTEVIILAPEALFGRKTTVNANGRFRLKPEGPLADSVQLIAMGGGLKSDSLWWKPGQAMHFILKPRGIQEITFEERASGTQYLQHYTIPTERLSSKELGRAACCNLSESFETNATVDVSMSDAVSGAKKIRMLGLDGEYIYLSNELIPGMRGLASAFGLNYIPGTWMESIQVSKGTGSVAYGYESMAGQINLEWQKPENSDPLFINLYLNHMNRAELNVHAAHRFNPRWSTLLLAHGSLVENYMDANQDGILDMPLSRQLNFVNRWKYKGRNREAQFGAKYLYETRESGTLTHFGRDSLQLPWNFFLRTHRAEVFGKQGFLWEEKCHKSVGIMGQAVFHDQTGNFGNRSYSGREYSGYLNFLYQTQIFNENHQIKTGASFLYDRVTEQFDDLETFREEFVPGIFGEYSMQAHRSLQIISGLRLDAHNIFGLQATPRMHAKWDILPNLAYRISGGSGFRAPNFFADHSSMLISGRQVVLPETFEQEKAWSFGNSLLYDISLGQHKLTLNTDLWYTRFENRLLVDREAEGLLLMRFNREPAFSLVSQTDVALEFRKFLEIRLGYKYQRVEAEFGGISQQEALVPLHRGLATTSFTWEKTGLQFDLTAQLIGPVRIPDATDLLTGENRAGMSPAFVLMFSQISWNTFKNAAGKPRLELYLGMENMLNYTQSNPLVNPHIPGAPEFDGALAWGPVFGRMVYTGFRWRIGT